MINRGSILAIVSLLCGLFGFGGLTLIFPSDNYGASPVPTLLAKQQVGVSLMALGLLITTVIGFFSNIESSDTDESENKGTETKVIGEHK